MNKNNALLQYNKVSFYNRLKINSQKMLITNILIESTVNSDCEFRQKI